MTTFTVWRSDDSSGAQHAVKLLDEASSQGLVRVVDQAVVTWPSGAARPEAEPPHATPKQGAAWGALWGAVAGILVALPVLGGVAGAIIGTKAAAGASHGISRRDLARIRAEVIPGTSALFLVTDEGDLGQLADRFRLANTTLVHTSVSA